MRREITHVLSVVITIVLLLPGVIQVNGGISNTLQASPILFVDDDQDPNYARENAECFYYWSFEANDYDYDCWEVESQGSPSAALLSTYQIVVWVTGDAWNNTLNSWDQTNISSYLDGGGRLFLTGEDIGYDLWQKNETPAERVFYTNYLHAVYHSDSCYVCHLAGADGDPIGDGLWLDIDDIWPTPTIGAIEPDIITPADQYASTVLAYTGDDTGNESTEGGCIRVDTGTYKLVYMSFRFSQILNENLRNTAMDRIITWLNSSTGDSIPPRIEHMALPSTSNIAGPYTVTATITDNNVGVDLTSLIVAYSLDTGLSYNYLSMTNTGPDQYSADIPGQPYGTTIYYYIQANDTNGNMARAPAIAPDPTIYYFGVMSSLPSSTNVLIVNDDRDYVDTMIPTNYHPVELKWMETMDDVGIAYDYHRVHWDGDPTLAKLNSYAVVIWFNVHGGDPGDPSAHPFTANSLSNLIAYMDGGGKLFVSSEVEAHAGWPSNFYSDYLMVEDIPGSQMGDLWSTRKGLPGDPIGDGLYLSVKSCAEVSETQHGHLQGDGDGFQITPDIFYPKDDKKFVTPIFRQTHAAGGIAGTKVNTGTYRNVYLGFLLPSVNNPADRKMLMFRILIWLMHGDEPIIHHYPLFDSEKTSGYYNVTAEILAPGSALAPSSLEVCYSTGSGFTPLLMSNVGGDNYTAQIPAQPMGTTVSYYITATTITGKTVLHPAIASESDLETCHQFIIRDLEDILLVDDDHSPEGSDDSDYETWYQAALDGNGYKYEYWDSLVHGVPEGWELEQYNVTVWFTDDHPSDMCVYTLVKEERDSISTYLNSGGKLFLTGPCIGHWTAGDDKAGVVYSTPESRDWFNNTLHATWIFHRSSSDYVDGIEYDPISDGFYSLIIDEGAANNYADVIEPRDGNASNVFSWAVEGGYIGKSAGIKVDTGTYRVVYFPFNFAGIETGPNRTIVMDRVIKWLTREGPSIVHQPLTDTNNTNGPYNATAKIFGENLDPSTFKVFYSIDEVTYVRLDMLPTGEPNEYYANIPGQPLGTVVFYYIQANNTLGESATHPYNAPMTKHKFIINFVVLVVNDDAVDSDDLPYANALDALGIGHHSWRVKTDGIPTASKLQEYPIVIWFVHNGFSHGNPAPDTGPMKAESQNAMMTYLDNGGRLYIAGRLMSSNFPDPTGPGTPFYDNYLHAVAPQPSDLENTRPTIYGNAGDPIGDGFVMPYNDNVRWVEVNGADPGPDTTTWAQVTDETVPNPLRNCALKIAETDYRAVYSGFVFAWLDNVDNRTLLMERVIDWLLDSRIEERELNEGWNLISTPFTPLNSELESVLSSIDSKYDAVHYCAPNTDWKHYSPYKPSFMSDMRYLNYQKGIWVHINQTGGATYTTKGPLPENPAIPLYTGWNMVGYPNQTPQAVNTLPSQIKKVMTNNTANDAGLVELTGTDALKPTYGYWMYVDSDYTWNIGDTGTGVSGGVSEDAPPMEFNRWGMATVNGKIMGLDEPITAWNGSTQHGQYTIKRAGGYYDMWVRADNPTTAGVEGASPSNMIIYCNESHVEAQETSVFQNANIPTSSEQLTFVTPTLEVQLVDGWNLISTPLTEYNDLRKVLDGAITDATWDAAEHYDASSGWKHHATFKPSYMNNLTESNQTRGIWVRATSMGAEGSTVYVSEYKENTGVVTNFDNAKDADDGGAYANLTEAQGEIYDVIFYETFPNVDGDASADLGWAGSTDTPQDESWEVDYDSGDVGDIRIDNLRPDDGDCPTGNHLDLRDCDLDWNGQWALAKVDLQNYTDVKIEFLYYMEGMDSGLEGFRFEVNSSSGWEVVLEKVGATNYPWTLFEYSLPDSNATADFQMRFNVAGSASGDIVAFDDIKITGKASPYILDSEFTTNAVVGADSYYLQINYSAFGEDFYVLVYNETSESWDDLGTQGDLTSSTMTIKEYTLDESHRLSDGSVRVRYIGRNEGSTDNSPSWLHIEYHRVKSYTASPVPQLKLKGIWPYPLPTIPLKIGWNMVSYPRETSQLVSTLPSQIDEVMRDDGTGTGGLTDATTILEPGIGYWMHVPVDYNWVVGDTGGGAAHIAEEAPPMQSNRWGVATFDGNPAGAGQVITVWNGTNQWGECTVWTGGYYDMWTEADNPTTVGVEGASPGDAIVYKNASFTVAQEADVFQNGNVPTDPEPLTFITQTTFEILLINGWNLISVPLIQTDTSILAVLSSINSKWDYVQYYDANDADHWKTYATFKPPGLNDLHNIDHTMGFWLHTTEPCTLNVTGIVPTSTNIPLYAGWNLVGYPSLTEKSISDALAGTGYDRVEGFNATAPYRLSQLADSYMMKPGEGYWVRVPSDTTWTMTNSFPPADSLSIKESDPEDVRDSGRTEVNEKVTNSAMESTLPVSTPIQTDKSEVTAMGGYDEYQSGRSSEGVTILVTIVMMLLSLVYLPLRRRRK